MLCCVKIWVSAFDIVLQRHGSGRMTGRRLGFLDVLRGVVDVRQHRGAEPLWHDGLLKPDVLPDPAQHPPKLCVAEGSIAAE